MKKTLKPAGIFFLLLLAYLSGYTQVKDINPDVQWNFVRSDSIPLLEGNTYIFKFPGKKGFDYILTFQHGEPDKTVTMEVYDMQGSLVAEYRKVPGQPSSDMLFDVEHNATYEVIIRVGDSTPTDPERYATLLSLLKREKV